MTTQQVEMSLLSAAETAIADSHAHTPVSVIRDTPSPQVVDEKFRKDVVVVELKNIHKTYLLGIEGVPALRGVSLSISRGEFVVIYGTSGGGKTSLLNIMGTIDKPTKGELTICNTLINSKTSDKVLAEIRLSKLGFVFQTFNLISSMTALENVELPMTLKGTVSSAQRAIQSKASLDKVGMGHRLDHFPSQLSGGEQQRVTIARAIANHPDLLLLDEPTGDLDTENSERVIELLMKLNAEENMTMIMVTHDMNLKNFANRVIWMRDGKVAKIEDIPALKREQAVKELADSIASKKLNSKPVDNEPSPISVNTDDTLSSDVNGNKTSQTWAFTEMRTPMDYKTHVFGLQRREQMSKLEAKTVDGSKNESKRRTGSVVLATAVMSPERNSLAADATLSAH